MQYIDANRISSKYLGDTIFSNCLLGMAYQSKLLPLKRESLLEARLNGAAVDGNLLALNWEDIMYINTETKVDEINQANYTYEPLYHTDRSELKGIRVKSYQGNMKRSKKQKT